MCNRMVDMKIQLAFVFLLGIIYSSDCLTCPGVFHQIGDGCYTFTEEDMTWVNASLVCEYAGGYLANIGSELEQTELLDYRQGLGSTWVYWWIGANDIVGEGTWRWVPTGQSLDYQNWGSGYPSTDISYYYRDCASWYNPGNYWTNEDCTTLSGNGALCEAEPEDIIG